MDITGGMQGRHIDEPNSRKAGVLKQTLLDFGAVPFPALVLGIAGLIPFVALAPPLASFLPLPVCHSFFLPFLYANLGGAIPERFLATSMYLFTFHLINMRFWFSRSSSCNKNF